MESRCDDPGYTLSLAGGGTGGHVVPGLHLLSHLRRAGAPPARVVWFLTGRAVEAQVLEGAEEELAPTVLERVPLALEPPGGGAPSRPRVLARAFPETLRARRALSRTAAKVVLGLGGFTSMPAALAAKSLGLPFALLEINAASGRATRALTPLAARIFHAWPDTVPARADERHLVCGPPLAPAFLAAPPDEAESAGERAQQGLDPERPLLLVLGGSQGAKPLNAFVRDAAGALIEAGAQVVHQVGPGRLDEGLAPSAGYRPVEYLRPVHGMLRAATLVLCRGGASTVAEVGATGRPAVVVPYPHSPDAHQQRNAERLGEGAVIVPQEELGERLLPLVQRLLAPAGADELRRRAAASAEAVPRDAGERMAEALLTLAKLVPRGG
ncbi:MAG: UDP-N-acetylglucosamine--N-acetylmuramyl-(pentapeptide) pyrophosphoryl-undecaprenol N-acetylglucosamine transferase [Planctomycetota bacterium]